MERLFRRWDVGMNDALSLQDVVTGFAHVKGTKDIMSNISYFFELYDDDGDGKVDREGILRISEALLFLSRRGVNDTLSPTPSTHDLSDASAGDSKRDNRDEQFLGSVSAFIRRCFEYADPDHPAHNEASKSTDAGVEDTANAVNAFSIGDDEEDLLDMESKPKSPTTPSKRTQSASSAANTPSKKSDAAAANVALDPSKPLHITLPTFRMVILADEILEQFFESAFSNSFRLADAPLPSSTSSSSNLTTFSNLGRPAPSLSIPSTVRAGGVVPPGKGLRGMLDNIVSDGMRVAAEVRRRMEEAQKEMDRAAREGREDEDEDDEGRPYGGDAERRSVRETDRELLEGAETEDVESASASKVQSGSSLLDAPVTEADGGKRSRSPSQASAKVVEFER
jgi:TBC1 domain family member 8/9